MSGAFSGNAAHTKLTGVTETLLFTIGIPYSPDSSRVTLTMFSAFLHTRSYTACAVASPVALTQGNSDMPIVTVRMSRCSLSTISIVSSTCL